MTNPFAPNLEACRGRQRRLLHAIESWNVDLVLLTSRASIQWLTGVYVGPLFEPVLALTPDGHATLVLPDRQQDQLAAAEEVIGYEAKWHSTMRNDQRAASTARLLESLTSGPQQVACEFSSFGPHFASAWDAALVDVEPTLFQLRRHKDPDELAMLARANGANRAMYEEARQMIEPGVNELDIYSALQGVAVRVLGEALTYFGQDFCCNARGGLPRDRKAQAGELYILDLGVGFRGYYSDNARTIAVDGRPTEEQQQAWEALAQIFPLIESTVRPGVSCQKLFNEVQERLDAYSPWEFNHHLGHGAGLAPHEGPHLNPNWDDTFEVGDFFTVEPGLYHDNLRQGIRLEQNYLVTEQGVELLTDWPLML